MKVLVTGSAGFIGFHLTKRIINEGISVIGLDNLNDYYDINLKKSRNKILSNISNGDKELYNFLEMDLEDKENLDNVFSQFKPSIVINLAAQAGVRYSLENPSAYINSNIFGFLNILESSRKFEVDNLIYASSSSVYGGNTKKPFSEKDNVDHPVSLYAATKKSNELMAHSYSHLYGIPTVGLRFFTVYGPWGRPDMALFKFTKNIIEGKSIDIYNHGKHTRDFTYIDDIVEGIVKTIDDTAESNIKWNGNLPDSATSNVPWRIYNIGNNKPTKLMEFIDEIENYLGKDAKKIMMGMQAGDVKKTWANVDLLIKNYDYRPNTKTKYGVKKFVNW